MAKQATGVPTPQVFRYTRPEPEGDKPKSYVPLSRTDISHAGVQLVRQGGETNLHAHNHMDGFWFVLSGRVRFYTHDDEVIAELGPHEGILIPRGYFYWFEAADETELEILQVESCDKVMHSMKDVIADRVDDPSTRPDWLVENTNAYMNSDE